MGLVLPCVSFITMFCWLVLTYEDREDEATLYITTASAEIYGKERILLKDPNNKSSRIGGDAIKAG